MESVTNVPWIGGGKEVATPLNKIENVSNNKLINRVGNESVNIHVYGNVCINVVSENN